MKLTIIEPHQHFGVLMRWVQVCTRTNWKVHIISSQSNWDKLIECIPEDCSNCGFTEISNINNFPRTDFLIFTSLQTDWGKWLKYVSKYPSGILIHNGNMYFRPNLSIAGRKESGLPFFKYYAKRMYERWIGTPQRTRLLQKAKFVTPFSKLQLAFFKKFSPVPVVHLALSFKPKMKRVKKNQVILYIYNRLSLLDIVFLTKQLKKYATDASQKVILIAKQEEFDQINYLFPKDLEIHFAGYPLPPKDYFQLLEESKAVCLPFKKNWIFNIYHEELGRTKYSGRIRDALEYGCELHVPEEISLEDVDQIPSLEEAAQLMDRKLKELYEQSHKE